ncbi:MFS transporter [Rubrobacter calidifluminis]|uniref:MFS transporter n=1 Tax=Rubrobacter calidifluminis TaxID=1392640 RepID=UPI0023626056|nr:MFS transporter [Rubrobacter calidifluminis]
MESSGGSLFRNQGFVRLWVGQAISFLGDAISMVALVVLAAGLGGRASAVGGILVARLLPTLAGPFVGVLADRLDRKAILVGSDLARAALTLGIIFTRDIFTLYVLVFLIGLAKTFFNPTIRAAFPSVVAGGNLTRANSIISSTFSTSISVGPALGGFLVATAGLDVAFALDAVSFLISAIFLALVPFSRPEHAEDSGFFEEFRSGVGYLLLSRVPLAVVVGASLIVFTTDLVTPAEIFLARHFGAGTEGYGVLMSLYGVGMVAGSALMATVAERVRLLPVYLVALLGYAVALCGAGLSPLFTLALAAITLAGISNGVDNVTCDTILQTSVPENFLGRVFSVRFLGFGIGEAVAYPLGGLLTDATGPSHTYLIAGIATALALTFTIAMLRFAPSKRG